MRLVQIPRSAFRLVRRLAGRRAVAVGALSVLAVGLAGSTAAYGYDRRTTNMLLPGTAIGGVKVGGLTVGDAEWRLRSDIEDPLHLPIRATAPGFARMTTPWDLGLRVDVDAAIGTALRRGRDGNLLRRLWRRVLGRTSSNVPLTPHLDERRFRTFVAEARDRVYRAPVDAILDSGDGWIHVRAGASGRELDSTGAERELTRAARLHLADVSLPVRDIEPAVPTSAFAKVILVRAGENKLYLYENGVQTRTYDVATGSPQFPTPMGTFKIVNKRKNPKWVNPGSDWAKRMPSYIPAGPDNPLGSRAMDLSTSGIRIHGTPDSASIGYSVSHGCVRMTMTDAEDLFSRVSVGTPVVIFPAAPPKAKPKAGQVAVPAPVPAIPVPAPA